MSRQRQTFLFLFFLFAITLSLVFFLNRTSCDRTHSKPKLVVGTYGGDFRKAHEQAYFKEFERKYNCEIVVAEYSGEYEKIKRMTQGDVIWDVVDVETYGLYRGVAEGLFAPIDYSVLPADDLYDFAKHPYGVGTDIYATILAYNRKSLSADPKGWADFWDYKRFPGGRCLRDNPVTSLEFALLADGVDPAKLYPLDVERAFRKLSTLDSESLLFWSKGAEPPSRLVNKDSVMTSSWSGRIDNKIQEGFKELGIVWQGGLVDVEWWVIPKASKNKDLAMKFIAFASQPERQAIFSRVIPYGPTNRRALEFLDDDTKDRLPTKPGRLENQVPISGKYWQDNLAELTERWTRWKQQLAK